VAGKVLPKKSVSPGATRAFTGAEIFAAAGGEIVLDNVAGRPIGIVPASLQFVNNSAGIFTVNVRGIDGVVHQWDFPPATTPKPYPGGIVALLKGTAPNETTNSSLVRVICDWLLE
jgi:hypothetical protein